MGREKERAKARKSTIFAIMCNYDDRVSVGVRLRYFEENISKFKTSQKRRREMRSPGKRERERERDGKKDSESVNEDKSGDVNLCSNNFLYLFLLLSS